MTTLATHPAKDLLIAIAMRQQIYLGNMLIGWEDALEAICKGEQRYLHIAPGQPIYGATLKEHNANK